MVGVDWKEGQTGKYVGYAHASDDVKLGQLSKSWRGSDESKRQRIEEKGQHRKDNILFSSDVVHI